MKMIKNLKNLKKPVRRINKKLIPDNLVINQTNQIPGIVAKINPALFIY